MWPEFPRFETLDLGRGLALREELARAPGLCDFAPANLLIWRDCEPASYTYVDQHLCILLQPHGKAPYFLEPLGPGSPLAAAETCLGHAGRISRASASFVQALPPRRYRVEALRDNADYVYAVPDLMELKGKKFDGKRNQIRHFTRANPASDFELLVGGHREQALGVFGRWEQGKSVQDAGPVAVACQRQALGRAFDDFAALQLFGGALLVGGALAGFVLASAPSPRQVIAHFQYADAGFSGVHQTLLWETCRRVFSGYAELNMEEDLGLAGLQKNKRSYHPLRLEEKFEIIPATD